MKAKASNRPKCNGYVCLFSCFDKFANTTVSDSSIRQFVIEYDYEVYATLDDTNIDDALAEVESKILSITSTQMGVYDCDVEKAELQFSFGNGYNWIFPDISLSAADAIIVSIASAPLDVVNGKKVACTQGIDMTSVDSTCIPILGSLKVGYYGDTNAQTEIMHSLLNLIERGANEAWFTTPAIKQIIYAGDKSDIFDPSVNNGKPEGKDTIDNEKSSVLTGAGIGITVAASVAMIFGTALLLRKTFRKSKKGLYQATPSPKAGNKQGLRSYDSECIRTNFDDEFLDIETPQKRFNLDPFEVEAHVGTPSVALEEALNKYKNTCLSTITEGSKETASINANRLSGLGSPPPETMQSFSRILSESTYSDGVHSLDRSNTSDDEFVEFSEEYMEPEELYGAAIFTSPTSS